MCNQPLSGHHPLAELQLKILPNAQPGDVLDFEVFDTEVGNFDPNDVRFIDSIGLDTSVRIIGGVCGDVTDSGTVDILDAIRMFQFALELEDPSEVQAYLGDLDGLFGINVIDTIIILQHIVGILDIDHIGCGPIEDRLGSIHGYKFDDLNMNGLWDDGEPGLPGWTIKLWEPGRDGGLELVGETETMHDDPQTSRDEAGLYWLNDIVPGVHVVTEEQKDDWHQSWPSSHVAWMDGDQEVPPTNSDGHGRAAINLIQNDEDDSWWIKFGVEWGDVRSATTGLHIHAAPKGANGPVLYNLADIAGEPASGFDSPVSGMFQLVPQTAAGQTLSVQDQTDLLNGGDLYVNLHTQDVPSGEIRGQIWPMYRQHHLRVHPWETVDHVNFGNWTENRPGSIHGAKWLDENGNGVAEANEPLLAGIKIELIDEGGNVVRTVHTMDDDPTTNEDEQGWFWIDDVPAGHYTLREYPGGMIPTWPSANLSRLRGNNQYSQTGSQGGALVTFVDDMDGGIWYKVWMGEDLQGTPLDIHIHDSGGILLDLEEKAGLNVSDPLPDNFQGMFTAADISMSLDDFWSMANSGVLYVNLHTSAFPGGEVAGGIERRGHQDHLVWLEPGQEETFLFGNKPGPEPQDDPCGCIIGIFETDQTHNWWVKWNGDATTVTEDLKVKVVAASVNPDESGSITATIYYGYPNDSSTTSDTVTVVTPTGTDATTNPENVGWLDIDETKFVLGQPYLMTVSYSGGAHHYKLGWKHGQEDDLWLGTNDIKYHEGVAQHWGVDADTGETVTLDFVTDDPNMGANQTGELEVEIVAPDGSTAVAPATLTLTPNTAVSVTFTASIDGMYVVKMIQSPGPGAGHFRVVRQGTDKHLWLLPCPEDDGPGGPTGSIHGLKYNDENGNGRRDPGEEGVPGVVITAVGLDGITRTTTTMDDTDPSDSDMTGWFWIEDVPTGDWVVTETVPAGWEATTPVSVTVNVKADTDTDPGTLASHMEFDCGYTLYVANEGNGGGGSTIVAVDCEGNVSPFASGFNGTSGLAVDASGQMFASDDDPNNGFYMVDNSGNVTPLTPRPAEAGNPNALNFDSAGRLLVGDAGDKILRITLDGSGGITGTEVIASGLSLPQGVLEDSFLAGMVFTDSTGTIFEVQPPVPVGTFPVGAVVPGNEGNIVQDSLGNLYTSDFNNRIVRVNGLGTISKDVVAITESDCPVGQAGRDHMPGFRGFLLDTEGDLIVTGYCRDEIYVFQADALQAAWDNDAPITTLPTPFASNPGTGPAPILDGILNGPFGMVLKEGAPDPDDPDVTFGNKRVPGDDGSIHGAKWRDDNGNGMWDTGEPGLAGIPIILWDANSNVVEVAVTMADETIGGVNMLGQYWFEDVQPGDYTVTERIPDNMFQTWPAPWGAWLSGDNDVSQTGSPGKAHATFVDDMNGKVWYKVWIEGGTLQGDPQQIHIHNPNGILIDLKVQAGITDTILPDHFEGMFGATELGMQIEDFWQMVANGILYVNLHTSAFGAGEIAGTIMRDDVQGHDVHVEAGDEIEGLNFGNKPVTPEPRQLWDFGDAPEPMYPTLLASDGARHMIDDQGPILGLLIDAEIDGIPDPMALGDDLTALPDEDGVVWLTPIIPGGTADVEVTMSGSGPAMLDAWVDFDSDGTLSPGDQIFASQPLVFGSNVLTFNVPAGSVTGVTFSRFRISSVGGLGTKGAADDGEVEDHRLRVQDDTPAGEIHGTKFDDANKNGVQDAGESGLAGWTIYLDLNNNGTMDAGEPSQVTDASGEYWFMDLRPGRYTVAEVQQTGWTQSAPTTAGSSATMVEIGVSDPNVSFVGTWLGPVLGTRLGLGHYLGTTDEATYTPHLPKNGLYEVHVRWSDILSGLGQHDANYEINHVGVPTDVQLNQTQTGDQWYKLGTFPFRAGTSGNVVLTKGSGFGLALLAGDMRFTLVQDGKHRIGLDDGQVVTGKDFGNWEEPDDNGSIHGWKWEDLNGNGVWDDGEPGVPGVKIDLWQSGQIVVSVHTMDDDQNTATNEKGMYWITDVPPGDYEVREDIDQNMWMQTYPTVWATQLSGTSTFNPNSTNPNGHGRAVLKMLANGDIEWWLFWGVGLTGAPTAAHIHGTPDGTTPGGVVQDLLPDPNAIVTVDSANGTFTPQTGLVDGLNNGGTYVNIHTAANTGGEIAGLIHQDNGHHVIV